MYSTRDQSNCNDSTGKDRSKQVSLNLDLKNVMKNVIASVI